MSVRFQIWRARHMAKVMSKHSTYANVIDANYAGITVGKYRRGKKV